MTRKAIRSGIQTGIIVAAILSVAAFASIREEGMRLEAGGVEVTLKTSLERGIQVIFDASA